MWLVLIAPSRDLEMLRRHRSRSADNRPRSTPPSHTGIIGICRVCISVEDETVFSCSETSFDSSCLHICAMQCRLLLSADRICFFLCFNNCLLHVLRILMRTLLLKHYLIVIEVMIGF